MEYISIDSGSSKIKMIHTDEKLNILNKMSEEKMSIQKALDIFLEKFNINIENINKIVVTGVGAGEITQDLYNIPTVKIDEFNATGNGAIYLTNLNKTMIVSIGTGTAFIRAENGEYKHIGGTGVGGGTLINLCKLYSGIDEFDKIVETAKAGTLKNVDLTIQDVSIEEIKTLPKDLTASNFGKLNSDATTSDILLGVINMIFETIGMMTVFALKNDDIRDVVVTGNIVNIPGVSRILKKIEDLYNIKFIIPENAEYVTAIGAVKII